MTQLKFTVTCEPHERHENMDIYYKATDLYLALTDIQELLRSELKYKDEPMNLDTFKEKFWEILRERDVTSLF
jgi:hypothetical protein